MRISTHYLNGQGVVDPCATNHTYGEFEDYSFEVVALDQCAGTPSAGYVDSTAYNVCANTPIYLYAIGASEAADGLTRNWQSSPAGQNQWTDIEDAVSPTYTYNAGIGVPTDFRFRVECSFSNESDISSVMSLGLNPANECYCTPVGTNASYYISSFSTTGGTSGNITNNNTGFSPGGYGDYTSMEVTQEPGGTVSFAASIQGGTAGFRIWVDWNGDGQFNTSTEVAYQSSSYGSSHSGSFTVPDGVIYGSTRMRVAMHYLNSTGDIDQLAPILAVHVTTETHLL